MLLISRVNTAHIIRSFANTSPTRRSLLDQQNDNVCMPNYQGDNCEWPVCGSHGRINVITHLCECYANFAPPFCEHCIDGFWGQQCTFSTVTAIDERSLTFLPRIYIVVSFGAVFVIILLTISSTIRVISKWARKTRNREAPPPYTLVDQVPPPNYSSEEEENQLNKIALHMACSKTEEYYV